MLTMILSRPTGISKPSLVAYTYAERWNGQLPAKVLGGAAPALPLIGLGRAAP